MTNPWILPRGVTNYVICIPERPTNQGQICTVCFTDKNRPMPADKTDRSVLRNIAL